MPEESFIETLNLLTFSWGKDKWRLLTLVLPWSRLIVGDIHHIMLDPQFICLLKLSTKINIPSKVIFGHWESSTMRCSLERLLGEQKPRRIWRNSWSQSLSKSSCLLPSVILQKLSCWDHLQSTSMTAWILKSCKDLCWAERNQSLPEDFTQLKTRSLMAETITSTRKTMLSSIIGMKHPWQKILSILQAT